MIPKRVILHCSDTPPTMDIGVAEIREWHTKRGFIGPDGVAGTHDDVGYHHVIKRNGTIEPGRDESLVGAHAKGCNKDSLGVCLVGGRDSVGHVRFTKAQLDALDSLYLLLLARHKIDWKQWTGHYEHTPRKTCPNLDMDLQRLRFSKL